MGQGGPRIYPVREDVKSYLLSESWLRHGRLSSGNEICILVDGSGRTVGIERMLPSLPDCGAARNTRAAQVIEGGGTKGQLSPGSCQSTKVHEFWLQEKVSR